MSETLKPLIGIAANRPLTRAEAEAAFNALFEGEGTPAQMGGFLMALRTRGETVDEYAAAGYRFLVSYPADLVLDASPGVNPANTILIR